ncbi:MAG: hypothetical protein ACRDKI_03070 [Solirubrobacterales bacterium]
MPTFDELNALSAQELHSRAIKRAEHHVDVKFFYDLLKALPVAEAAAGNDDQSTADIFKIGSLVQDLFDSDEGDLAESLRPFYIDYLLEHES